MTKDDQQFLKHMISGLSSINHDMDFYASEIEAYQNYNVKPTSDNYERMLLSVANLDTAYDHISDAIKLLKEITNE